MNTYFKKARNALQEGHHKEAIALYQEIKKKYPELAKVAEANINYIENFINLDFDKPILGRMDSKNLRAILKDGAFYKYVCGEVKSQKYRCISFDFFDTLVFRVTELPSDIFHIAAPQITNANNGLDALSRDGFRNYRIRAEREARLSSKFGPEVNLREIYSKLKSIDSSFLTLISSKSIGL
jgi:hypothetical protein